MADSMDFINQAIGSNIQGAMGDVSKLESLAGKQGGKDTSGMQRENKAEQSLVKQIPSPDSATKAPEIDKKLPSAPAVTETDPIDVFKQIGPAMMVLGSLAVRHNAQSSIITAAAMMNAYKSGEKEKADRLQEQWKDEVQKTIDEAKLKTEDFQNRVEASKGKIDLLDAGITAHAKLFQNEADLAAVRSGNMGVAFENQKALLEARTKMGDMLTKINKTQAEDPARKQQIFDTNYEAWKKRPESSTEADAVAKGQPPSQFVRGRSGNAQDKIDMLERLAKERHPEYDPTTAAEDYNTARTALRSFGTGKQGDMVRSFNVAYSHADLVGDLAKALGNGDVPAINSLSQRYAEETGQPAPTNFEAAKSIFSDEVTKAAVGGTGALADREQIQNNIRKAQSPAQLEGAIESFKKLIGGQMAGIGLQYEQSTGRKDFDRFLFPVVEKDYKEALKKYRSDQSGGKRVKVYDPQGNPHTIDESELSDALSHGWKKR